MSGAPAPLELPHKMKEKAKELLGFNLPANVVAAAIGVTPSMVSQWLSDEQFAGEVQQLRIENLAGAANRDRKYNTIEDALLGRLEESLENRIYFLKPQEILHALKIVNAAVRRGAPQEVLASAQQTIIPLQLPENSEFAVRFIMNKENQVIEIAGRSVATMGAKAVLKKLEERKVVSEQNGEAERKDIEGARERLKNLSKLTHLPVAEVL